LKRKELDFFEIRKNLLSPGDIFWIKRSGDEVLISSKGDLLNLNLISKLEKESQKVVIENYIDETDILEINELFERYQKEILIKDKIVYREKILKFFHKKIVEENQKDIEINVLFWKIFSELGFEFGTKFVEIDRDYFDRALTIGGLTILGHLLLGFYDLDFLKKSYSNVIRDFKNVLGQDSVMSFKDKMESFREKDGLLEIDQGLIKNIKTTLFEKDSSLGLKKTMHFELSDYEILMAEINSKISYKEKNETGTIYKDFLLGKFQIENRFNNLIVREISKITVRAS